MFSFGNKKPNSAPKSTEPQVTGAKPKSLAQFGFLEMGFQTDDTNEADNSDDDLEAELSALTQGSSNLQKKKTTKKMISEKELAAMVSSSLADLPSDAEISDIDDEEVENELVDLCGNNDSDSDLPQHINNEHSLIVEEILMLLNERLDMYKVAESNASKMGDTMKARRFNRGVKCLNDLLKQTHSGKPISMEDIPPPLAESNKAIQKPVPKEDVTNNLINFDAPIPSHDGNILIPTLPVTVSVRVAPLPPNIAPPIPPRVIVPQPMAKEDQPRESGNSLLIQSSTISSNIESALAHRQDLKNKALQAKRAGNAQTALQFVRLIKVCDQMIDSAKQGLSVDWSCLPSINLENEGIIASNTLETSSLEVKPNNSIIQEDIISPPMDVANVQSMPVLVPIIPIPQSTLEALEQRLTKYQSIMQQAQEEGNSSKARRFGRIVKQYQDAIKLNKHGKPVPFDELPDPPGYPPIPGAPQKAEEMEGSVMTPAQSIEFPPSLPTITTTEKPSTLEPATSTLISAQPAKILLTKTPLATRQDKQLVILLERQSMFKQAALESKRSNELELAKEYLRMAKGIDPLISANKCGVPVDMDTLPIPPQMKLRSTIDKHGSLKLTHVPTDEFVIVSSEECVSMPTLEEKSIFAQLETDLLSQFKMCSDNREHYKLLGDIASANRFDQLALHTRKDLDVIRSSAMRGDKVPRWKNEMRTFSIVKCCTDLKDDDMEVTILRGLSYNVANPKTIDTYVRFEVPLPNTENPTREKTNTVKDTNSPEYNETFHVAIGRQSRTLLRIFKAKVVKLEVWAKGGFLRSDILIGTASVKLVDLLNHCIIHEAADLMDGRKPVGGKLEVKIRLRNPIVGKEMEQVQEKWTVLTC